MGNSITSSGRSRLKKRLLPLPARQVVAEKVGVAMLVSRLAHIAIR